METILYAARIERGQANQPAREVIDSAVWLMEAIEVFRTLPEG